MGALRIKRSLHQLIRLFLKRHFRGLRTILSSARRKRVYISARGGARQTACTLLRYARACSRDGVMNRGGVIGMACSGMTIALQRAKPATGWRICHGTAIWLRRISSTMQRK